MAAFEQGASAEGAPVARDRRLMLFSGRANPDLAAAIAEELGVELGGVTLKTFSAGEVYCRYDESVRDADVFIVQPTCDNEATGVTHERRAGRAAADDRRRRRRLGEHA